MSRYLSIASAFFVLCLRSVFPASLRHWRGRVVVYHEPGKPPQKGSMNQALAASLGLGLGPGL